MTIAELNSINTHFKAWVEAQNYGTGTVSPDEMNTAIADYIVANNLEHLTSTQVAQQITDFWTANPDVDRTDLEVNALIQTWHADNPELADKITALENLLHIIPFVAGSQDTISVDGFYFPIAYTPITIDTVAYGVKYITQNVDGDDNTLQTVYTQEDKVFKRTKTGTTWSAYEDVSPLVGITTQADLDAIFALVIEFAIKSSDAYADILARASSSTVIESEFSSDATGHAWYSQPNSVDMSSETWEFKSFTIDIPTGALSYDITFNGTNNAGVARLEIYGGAPFEAFKLTQEISNSTLNLDANMGDLSETLNMPVAIDRVVNMSVTGQYAQLYPNSAIEIRQYTKIDYPLNDTLRVKEIKWNY